MINNLRLVIARRLSGVVAIYLLHCFRSPCFQSAKAWQKQRATLYLHPPPSLRDTPSKEGHVERNGFKPFPTVCGSEDPYYERKNSTSVACRHLRQRRTLIVGRVSQNAPLRTVRGTVPTISTSVQFSFITVWRYNH